MLQQISFLITAFVVLLLKVIFELKMMYIVTLKKSNYFLFFKTEQIRNNNMSKDIFLIE